MELPKEFKGTIYFYYWPSLDRIVAYEHESDDKDFILLGTKEVEAEFNVSHDDAVSQIVSNLKQEKTRIQAETQGKLNQIDEQINNLLAITYQS